MTNKLREETRLCFCGGLLVGEELYEEDGYYFLTDKGQDVLLERLSQKGLASVPDEFELPSAPIPCPETIPNDVYYYRGYEQALRDCKQKFESQIGRL